MQPPPSVGPAVSIRPLRWVRFAVPALLALATGGCAGGVASIPFARATGAAVVPQAAAAGPMSPTTSYVVSIGSNGAGLGFGVGGLDGGSALAGALGAAGTTVVYPDGSYQTTDAHGAFDAGQSAWAAANASAAAANPALTPTVVAFGRTDPVIPVLPAVAALVAYAPGAGSAARPVADATASLAAIDVEPAGVVLAAGRSQVFTALGRYSDGELAATGLAGLTWSLVTPAGCGAPAGTLAADATDPQRIRYVPPTAGSSAAGCPDVVSASVPAPGGGSIVGGTGISVSTGSPATTLAALFDRSGMPVPGAVVVVGSGPTTGAATAAVTATGGLFRAAMPSDRTAPTLALVPAATASAGFGPTVIAPGAPGRWSTLGTPPAAVAPPMPGDQLFRDAEFFGRIAWTPFPFGEMPNPVGNDRAGSLQALLGRAPALVARTHGRVSAGPYGQAESGVYQGDEFRVDPSGTRIALASTAESPPYELLTIARGEATGSPAPCPSGSACFVYARYRSLVAPFDPAKPVPASATLDVDGSWSQSTTGTAASVTMLQNDYDAGHQSAGGPLYVHRITVAQNLGATQLTIGDTVETPGGTTLATQSFARNLCSAANAVGPCAAPNVLYAISGTTDRTLIRADGGSTIVRYILGTPGPLAASVASCPQAYCLPASGRAPGSVGFEYAIAASPQASDVGTELAWLEPGTTPTTNAATLVSGVLTAGSFTTDATGLVTLGEHAGTATTMAVFPL